MISQAEAADLAARQRYAENLFHYIQEKFEEPADEIALDRLDDRRFQIRASKASIEVEANKPIGSVAIKHIASTAFIHTGTIELSDCRYPWDCRVTFVGCEWLEIPSSRTAGASASPNPSLNEYGEQIAAALMNNLMNNDDRRS
jgi:hypothetical protein